MSATPTPAFSLGRESSDDGSFRRQESAFRRWVTDDDSAQFPLRAGRYHLYVARACPWAHRTIIARRLMGLEEAIGISYVDPIRDERGWAFTGGEYIDPLNGFEFLSQAYTATNPDFDARVTVPVLWDKRDGVIVNNESADVLRMLGTVFAPLAEHPIDLYPESLREDIDGLSEFIYDNVNNAVYKAGFATRQEVYEREVISLFAALDELDERLSDRRFLFGAEPVETDIRLVHDAPALRRRLPDPFQVLFAQADRVRAPVAVHARPLSVARRRRDGELRGDPPPLLPDPSDDQPFRPHGPPAAGQFRRAGGPRGSGVARGA